MAGPDGVRRRLSKRPLLAIESDVLELIGFL